MFASEQLSVSAQIGTCLKEENKIDCRAMKILAVLAKAELLQTNTFALE
jgi:hypothetical protein